MKKKEGTKSDKNHHLSRRGFLQLSGTASDAAAAVPLTGLASKEVLTEEQFTIPESVKIVLKINGESTALRIDPRASLLDTLRYRMGLTGTKKGCDAGHCGACTVHINGERRLSCLTLAMGHQQDEILTIEGLAKGEALHPLQEEFITHDAFQCGYCTAGQVMSGVACIKEGHTKSTEEIREYMSGNICRCGAYPNIIKAIEAASQKM